jgi:deoxyribonuclease-4
MSIGGGVSAAVERIARVEGRALQLFTKSSNQWSYPPIPDGEAERFRSLREEHGVRFAFAHDSYLINLASPDDALREKSRRAFLDEVDRADLLGLDFIVFHPGAHMGQGAEAGCRRVAGELNAVLEARPDSRVMLLIENAAGQGTTLGRTFEELDAIRSAIGSKDRVGFCFDTCHAFAAGYDLRTEEGYRATMTAFAKACGIENLRAFHVNDSKKGLDCRVDRHEHIGKGMMGLEPFRLLLNDPRFSDRPMVLETPKSEDLHEDAENLAVLKKLLPKDRGRRA